MSDSTGNFTLTRPSLSGSFRSVTIALTTPESGPKAPVLAPAARPYIERSESLLTTNEVV